MRHLVTVEIAGSNPVGIADTGITLCLKGSDILTGVMITGQLYPVKS